MQTFTARRQRKAFPTRPKLNSPKHTYKPSKDHFSLVQYVVFLYFAGFKFRYMKQFVLLFSFFLATATAYSQGNWNFVGTASGFDAAEVDLEITPNGQLYMACTNPANQGRVTVRKWVNNTWQLIGPASFGPNNGFDIQIISAGEETPVVSMKHFQLIGTVNYEFIGVYRWNGTAWAALSMGGYPHTYHSKGYSIASNSAGTVFLSYYNRDYQTHDEGMITVNMSTSQQLGPVMSDWQDDVYSVSSYAVAGNDVRTVVNELADMDYASDLRIYNTPANDWYTNSVNFNWGDQAYNMKLKPGYNNTTHCVMWKSDTPLLKYAFINGGTSYPITIANSSSVTDFDFDTGNGAVAFYRNGSTCYYKTITMSATPAEATLTTGTALAPADASSLATETYYGTHVIAYVSAGKCYVKEYDVEANLEDYDILNMCEGTSFNNSGDYVVYCLDPNYDHSNMTMTCTSQNTAVIPQSGISVTGGGLYWGVNITGTNDVASTTVVDLLWRLYENGIEVSSMSTPVTIYANPSIAFNLPTTDFCENHSQLSLIGKATPPGGTWSGTGVNGNYFHPTAFNPNPAQNTYLVYSKTSPQGCTAKDSILVTINQTPDLTVDIDDADCGEANGGASVTISGGASPYVTYWSNGSTFTSVDDLSPGQYFVNVTDNNGCSATGAAMIGSDGITLSGTTTNVNCNGETTGAINLNVIGTGPFTFNWSNGATTEDVSSLPAGPYEVEVSDNSGCVSTASFTVFEPAGLNLSNVTLVNPSCEDTDGSITVSYTGGSGPFTYSWLDGNGDPIGSNSATLSAVGAGFYTSQVTDDNGCTASFPVLLSNSNGPVVVIDTIVPSSCIGDGYIELLDAFGDVQEYAWSTGETTQGIYNLEPGTYMAIATGSNGCSTVLSATVEPTQPEAVEICLVTVDTLTNTNLVVWEKPLTNAIDHFNIYRETSQAGLYQLAGSVDYDDESLYNDLVASPSVRSWRYKISAVDGCGVESELSEHHKTIHLVINLGLDDNINLSWDTYEGFPFPEFVLRRHVNGGGWQTIQTMPTTLFTYTDTPPTTDGLVYLVTISPPLICSTSKSLAQDFNSSRSNKDNRLSMGLNSLNELLAIGMQIFPNPSNGTVTIQNKAGVTVDVNIYDASGRLLKTFTAASGSTQADLSELATGIYQVVFSSGNASTTQKLTIQH